MCKRYVYVSMEIHTELRPTRLSAFLAKIVREISVDRYRKNNSLIITTRLTGGYDNRGPKGERSKLVIPVIFRIIFQYFQQGVLRAFPPRTLRPLPSRRACRAYTPNS